MWLKQEKASERGKKTQLARISGRWYQNRRNVFKYPYMLQSGRKKLHHHHRMSDVNGNDDEQCFDFVSLRIYAIFYMWKPLHSVCRKLYDWWTCFSWKSEISTQLTCNICSFFICFTYFSVVVCVCVCLSMSHCVS